ncbi:hypothetical protein H0H93_015223 [Arthromyces matolae]|nr:hypothetical protein H0H93_015223 [Arthromyces matolae]
MAQVDHSNASVLSDKAEPQSQDSVDIYQVAFEPSDPSNPQNWSRPKRWYLTMASGLLVLNATFASSSPSGIAQPLAKDFKMSDIETVLMISLFVAGYCVGPLLWGPLSEQYGRRPIFIYTFIVYAIFQVAVAVSKNTTSILVFRFLGGVFAAAPLTNSGALISDIWDAKTRGKALAIFTVAPFAGPALGPTAAGFLGEHTTWRWVFWILAIFAGVCWLLIIFTIPETYAPVLLVEKARQKRKETNDDRFYAPMEKDVMTPLQRAEKVLARPFIIFVQEPMLIAITTYLSFVYGCLYLLFQAYPVVFTEGHHFSAGSSSLMFIPIPVGGTVAVILYVLIINPRYERLIEKYQPNPVPPEARLGITLIAGPLFALSFFWFAWSSFPSISFWAPMLSGGLMGFAICWIFLGLFNYIVDAYLAVAASAMASNTVIRSLFGFAFPLFATKIGNDSDPPRSSEVRCNLAPKVQICAIEEECRSLIPSFTVLHTSLLQTLNRGSMPPMMLNGVVTKAGFMQKTATVTVSRWVVHKLTGKRIERSKKYLVHDEKNQLRKDDSVVIRNCPPKSALKRFELRTVLKSPSRERELARSQMTSGVASTTTTSTIS